MSAPQAPNAELDAIFGAELADRVPKLNQLALELEQMWSDAGLVTLGREFHSLKGAARVAGADAAERLAHVAEGAIMLARIRTTPAPQPWFQALFSTLDALPLAASGTAMHLEELIGRLQHGDLLLPPVAPARPQPSPVPFPSNPEPLPRAQGPAPVDSGTVRVAISKLDMLLTESGELSVTHLRIVQRLSEVRDLQRELDHWRRDWRKTRPLRARLARGHVHVQAATRDVDALLRLAERADQQLQVMATRTSALAASLTQNTAQLGAVATGISQEVMAIRLMPASTIFMPMERLVRDLSRQTGKETRLVLSGTDTELDRRILDELRDPLMHMVRNSIDHAIEPALERIAAGKPAHGTLHLSSIQRGDRVQISVEDDGRGIDIETIRSTAVARGLITPERAEALDTPAVIDLVFHPGFTTRTNVSELSGRGVGMDVVREHVRRLGGTIDVRTTAGAGTCFTMTVPLTLATTRVLLVEDRGQTLAVPSSAVERTGRARLADLLVVEGRRAIHIDGRTVPVVELADVLQHPRAKDTAPSDAWRSFFVLAQADRSVALLTDRLVDEQELVVKGLGTPLRRVRHVGGAAVLGTGAVAVILNALDLIKSALGGLESGTLVRHNELGAPADKLNAASPAARRRIMVVDDSIVTRTLERSILEAGGYEVVVAGDGVQALELLQTTPVDAIVSDVEMPRMDGLELTYAIRQNEALRHLPVVLVTSLDAPEHVERGASAGADAYIVKGRFDQAELLATMGRFL